MRTGILGTVMATACLSVAAPARAEVEGTVSAGMGKPTGDDGGQYDWGLTLGGSVGGRVVDRFSMHGQLQLGLLNFDTGADVSGQHWQIGLLPLVHLLERYQSADLFVGPALGWYRTGASGRALGVDYGGHVWGWHLGALFGALFQLNRDVGMGFYLQYARLFPQEACGRAFGYGGCNDDPSDDGDGFVSVGLALGF